MRKAGTNPQNDGISNPVSAAPVGPPSTPTVLTPPERDQILVSAYDGIYAPMFRYPTFSLDTLLNEKGYDHVENMLNMSACRSMFNLKRYAVLRDGWSIQPAVSDPDAPDFDQANQLASDVLYAFNNIRDPVTDYCSDMTSILFDIMLGAWTGNRTAEIDWLMQEGGQLDGKHGLRGIWVKRNKQIGFDLDPNTLQPLNITQYTPAGGYDFSIPVEKCLVYTHGMQSQDPHGIGDWRACYKHWFRLDANLKFWAMALERWGAPVLLMMYPNGSESDMQAAQKAAKRITQGAPAVIPDNVKYEILKAPDGVFSAMQAAADYDGTQISLNIHSNILSTSEGENGSTSAGADEHANSGHTVYDSLARSVENVINQQLIRRFVRYNYGDAALTIAPYIEMRRPDDGDVFELAQMLQILINAGNMPSRSKIIRETLGLPAIDQDEQQMLDDEAAAKQEAAQQLATARNSNQVGAMNDAQSSRAIETLTQAIYNRNRLAKEARGEL